MINSRDIKELHPALQRAAKELIRRMDLKGYPLAISSTYRDFEYQTKLYAQGRTTPGGVVTNAKAGESIHNYRLAFDVFKNVKGQEFNDYKFFAAAGNIGTEMGLEWGGNWKGFVDTPHFQFTNGLTLKDLQSGKLVSQDVKMKWELQIIPDPKPIPEEIKVVKKPILVNNNKIEVNSILKDGRNYIELQSLKNANFEISYNEKEKLPTITSPTLEATKKPMLINNKKVEVNSILKDGRNYIELQSLKNANFEISYNEKEKLPIIISPK